EDGFLVPWPERAKVDHLGFDAVSCETLRSRRGDVDLFRPGDDRHIAALAYNSSLAKGHDVVRITWHISFERPHVLVLHVDDGIVATDGGLQQPFIVGWRRRADHHEARNVDVPGFQRLRMLGCR